MPNFIAHKKIALLLCLTCFIQVYGTKTLSKTVLFKLLPSYSHYSVGNEIQHPSFSLITSSLNMVSLQKVFTTKSFNPETDPTNLSLIYQLTYSANLSENEVAQRLQKLPFIDYTQCYYLPSFLATPNDLFTSQQYFLPLIQAFAAFDITTGDSNVVIGIVDSGWEPTHSDLKDNVKTNYNDPIDGIDNDNDGYIDNYKGWDLADQDNDAAIGSLSHGVAVTGVAAASTNNNTGVASVGYNSRFLPVKIADAAGSLTHAYQGIVYAADHGCAIINCSWGGKEIGLFEKDIIQYAQNKNCLIVAAAGNDNSEDAFYPASFEGVLSVAATDANDAKTNISSFGPTVDLTAPGINLFSVSPSNYYSGHEGTSVAAPLVSGAAALVKSIYPNYTYQQIAALLKATTDNIDFQNPSFYQKLGAGRLNVFNAVNTSSALYFEAQNISVTDHNDNLFYAGDTLFITADFINLLAPTTNLLASISSSSSFVSVLQNGFNLGNMATLETKNNSSLPFKIVLKNGLGIGEEIPLDLFLTNGSTTANQVIKIFVNPNFITVRTPSIQTSFTNNGLIGFTDDAVKQGVGFVYKNESLLSSLGIMIGNDPNRLMNCVPTFLANSTNDFKPVNNIALLQNPKADIYTRAVFSDGNHPNSFGFWITQHTFADTSSSEDKYVILSYDVYNNSATSYSDLSFGLFANWDIRDSTNFANFDTTNKIAYVYDYSATDSIYAGIKLLSSNNDFVYSFPNLSGGFNAIKIDDGFSSSEKYKSLLLRNDSAGGVLGADVSHVVGSPKFDLTTGESKTISFAIIVGDNLTDLQQNASLAQKKFDDNNLSVSEKIPNKLATAYPNPTTGKVFLKTKEKIQGLMIQNILTQKIVTLPPSNTIDLNNYPNGVYAITIVTEKGQQTMKVVKVNR